MTRSADPAPAAAPPDPETRVATGSSSADKALVWSGGAAVLLITLAHPSATRVHTWPWALGAALLWTLPIVALVVQACRAKTICGLPGRILSTGLVALALAAAISAWLSPFGDASRARVWPTLAGVAFYFLLHGWLASAEKTRLRRAALVARAIALGGALVVGVSLCAWLGQGWPAPWAFRNDVPFGHSNYTAGAVVLLLPWFALQIWTTRGAGRFLWGLVVLATLIALAVTSSRGGMLALACMAASAVLGILVWARWARRSKLLLVAAGLGLAVLAILANPRLRELALRGSWSDGARESNRQRSAMLAAGVKLGAERPFLGWGPGSVPLAYPRVRAALDGGVDNVLQLHNTPVQIWATLGAAGALALLLVGGGAAIAMIQALRPTRRSSVALTATASLVGGAVVALTDHPFDLPFIVAVATAGLAFLTSEAEIPPAHFRARPIRISFAIGLAAIAGIFLPATARDLRARQLYAQGLETWSAGGTDNSFALATQIAPHDPFFAQQAASYFIARRHATADPAQRLDLTLAAVAQLEASLRAGTHAEYAHFNLGWLQLDLGQPAAAAPHFVAAAQLVPDKGGVYFGLGLAWHAAGHTEAAVRAFALEWINDPRSLTSPAWEVPALAALRSAVQTETLRLYAGLRENFPAASAAERWTRWWLGEPAALSGGLPASAFNAEMASFAADVTASAIRSRAPLPTPTPAPWATLYTAWRLGEFSPQAGFDASLGAALARRRARHPENFQAFLLAGTEDEAPLLRTFRRERPGAGVLALHPDGPPLNDAYIVQENRLIADYAAALFPPKGWLPGRFLLALLPPDPR